MKVIKIPCSEKNYGGIRKASDVIAVVIHNTGGTNDTAENNGNFFKNPVKPERSAHYFIDRNGVIVKSVDRCKIAWSVGTPAPGVKYNNANTISIELCAIAKKEPTQAQIKSCNELIKFIKRRHKNCKEVIRHYDVNGKNCPALYVDNAKWKELKKEITK